MTDDVTPPSRLRWRLRGEAFSYAVVAALVMVATTQVRWGENLDARAASSMGSHARWWMQHIDVVTVPLMCLLGFVALVGVGIQLARGNAQYAVRAVNLVAGTQFTAEVLKHVVHREDGALNTMPSGHTSLAAGLAVVAVSLWSQTYVKAFALGISGFVAYGTVIGGWHTPGDVVAACAITGFWSSVTGVCNRRPAHIGVGEASIGLGMLVASAGLHPAQVRLVPAALSFIAVWAGLYVPLHIDPTQRISYMRRERK